MSRSTVNVSFQDLGTGQETRYWFRRQLLERFQVSEATFKRDMELLVSHPRFRYVHHAETFSDEQRHCLEFVHKLRTQGLNKVQITQEIQKGIPPYALPTNIQRVESSVKRQFRRRIQADSRSRQQIGK